MNRMLIGALVLLGTASASHADDTKSVRVIPITREASVASAAAIAAAKNPTLGVRAQGQQDLTRVGAKAGQVARTAGRERAREARYVREARAEVVETPRIESGRPTRRVEVISPSAVGRFVVRVFDVSAAP